MSRLFTFIILISIQITLSVSNGSPVYYHEKPLQNEDSTRMSFVASSMSISDSSSLSATFYRRDSIFSFRSQKGYFPSLVYNFGVQATAPFRFSSKQWLLTGAALGITEALIHVDGDIDEWAKVQKQKHVWVNKSSPVVTKFGESWGVFTFVATGLLGASIKDEKLLQTSLMASQAYITSGIWMRLIKILTGRERPLADYTISKKEGGTWYGPFAMYDQDLAARKPVSAFDAFPSGHTATAFSIATVFASEYKDNKAVPFICYSAASLVGISRLTEHEHWASDVFVGGLVGYLCGKQVVNHFNKTHPISVIQDDPRYYKKEITFFENGNQVGLSIVW